MRAEIGWRGVAEFLGRFRCKDLGDDARIFQNGSAGDGLQRFGGHAERFGRDGVARDFVVAHFGDKGVSRQRNFVQAARAVDDEGARYPEFAQRFGDGRDGFVGVYAEDLRGCASGVGERGPIN